MTATAEIIPATVKYSASSVKQTEFGPRINVLVTLHDGSEQRIWGDPTDAVLSQLKKGQQLSLLKVGKGYKIANIYSNGTTGDTVAAPVSTPQKPVLCDEQKRAIAAYVQDQAALYHYCWRTAAQQMKDIELTPDVLRAIASTLYLATQRQFNL